MRPHPAGPAIVGRARRLRREATPAEAKLWPYLRNGHLGGLKFRRQCPVGRYIADFCCIDRALVVEVDGASHNERGEYDAARTAYLESLGLRVIRFEEVDVYHDLAGVVEAIAAACGVDLG